MDVARACVQAASKDRQYLLANELYEQLKHAQTEYDATYKSAGHSGDDTSN